MREPAGAVAFLTRLPVPGLDPQTPLHRLAAWFPLAGLVVGAIAGGTYWASLRLGLSPAVATWAAIVAEMLVTGALHPDGLADTADGLGGATPERRLEIMKDPRLGSYGGVALLLALGGRGVLLAALPPARVLPLLMLAHAAARWAPVWALARYPYARPGGGTGVGFAGAGWREVFLAGATALGAAALLGGPAGLSAAVASGLAGAAATAFLARKLGGITGDVCGAVTEVALLAALLVLGGLT
ncbi:MAG TPA: adenosylcobinamide-GDP ribazoletransferase [Symbiobacteriaceae bacterium]|jgi:adenosylcobinamide-GDP ribazoletransferase